MLTLSGARTFCNLDRVQGCRGVDRRPGRNDREVLHSRRHRRIRELRARATPPRVVVPSRRAKEQHGAPGGALCVEVNDQMSIGIGFTGIVPTHTSRKNKKGAGFLCHRFWRFEYFEYCTWAEHHTFQVGSEGRPRHRGMSTHRKDAQPWDMHRRWESSLPSGCLFSETWLHNVGCPSNDTVAFRKFVTMSADTRRVITSLSTTPTEALQRSRDRPVEGARERGRLFTIETAEEDRTRRSRNKSEWMDEEWRAFWSIV
jgi:hypothetical protein